MNSKVKDLAVRAASGVVLTVVVITALMYSWWSFGLFLLAITIGGVLEFYKMSKAKGIDPQQIAGVCSAVAIFGFGFDYFFNGSQHNIAIVLFMALIIPLMFVVELFKGGDRPLSNVGTTVLALIYVAIPMSMLTGVPLLLSGGAWQPLTMLFYIFIIWSNDTFAYLVGVPFGKHRLNERISPKKSWEGFFGGIVGAILMSVFAAYYLESSYLMWVGVGVLTSTIGCLGDLVESMFKRTCGVKDSGAILPGHGGWLDRFDGLIFSAPFVFVYLVLLKLL